MRNRAQETYWRKHKVDTAVFDLIDTEGKAYVLGFVAADGYVSKDGLNFTLSPKDADILIAVKAVLGSTHPIRETQRGFVALDISSRVLARRLAEMGLSGKKTFKMDPPSEIPDSLLVHWLRGYWDGDGWLTTRPRAGGLGPVVGVAGWSQNLMEFVCDLSGRYAEAQLHLGAHREGWVLRICSKKAQRWIEAVYGGATIVSARKNAIAKKLMALPEVSLAKSQSLRRSREYKERYAERNEEMRKLKQDGWRIKDIAEKFGLRPSIVSMICSGKRGQPHV